MRERPEWETENTEVSRITPAYAGKTPSRTHRPSSIKDHPRVCGKDVTITPQLKNIPGSPPRMRERLEFAPAGGLTVRITPAYAGKTFPVGVGSSKTPDHPRVCGKDKLGYRFI